jgi:hypothetical protein
MNYKQLFFTAILICGFICYVSAQSPSPYNIQNGFSPSGYMGDIGNIRLVRNQTDTLRSDGLCTKITYSPGSQGWGGVYWQYPANNWCEKKGKDLSSFGYTKITFWVKGENGGEEVKFKSGHDCGDSYTTDEVTKILGKEWAKVTIDLKGKNLSNITGAFCWNVDSKGQPVTGATTFYIDDVQYE